MTQHPRAVRWFAATTFLGALYFVTIGIGYLSFAGVLPDLRLRYVLTALFVAMVVFRTFIFVQYKAAPAALTIALYGLFGLITVIQALWYIPIADGGGTEVYTSTIGNTIVASGIACVMGECLGQLWVRGGKIAALWLVGIAFTICVLTIGMGVVFGWSRTAEMRLLFRLETTEMTFNYLTVGDSIALLGLLMMGIFSRPIGRMAILFVAGSALFFSYSRTSFFLFLFSSAFVLFIGSKNAQKIGIAALLAILLTAVVSIASESDLLRPAIERMTVLLFEREADESYIARKIILSEGLQYLGDNWITGRFLDEWWRGNTAGGYIHNWLSFWQSYGVFPFLFSLLIFGAVGFSLWRNLKEPKAWTGVAIAVWTFAILAIITSRAYSWPYLWLSMGFVTAVTSVRPDENRVRSVLA